MYAGTVGGSRQRRNVQFVNQKIYLRAGKEL